MDELHTFCVRLLGDGADARAVEQAARASGAGDRVAELAVAASACRERRAADPVPATPALAPGPDRGLALAQAVAGELTVATAGLDGREREALALRELLDLPYADVARVIGVAPADVAPLVAGARLRLRCALRGDVDRPGECPEYERTLRTCALRHDGQPVAAADDDWLMEHLGHCAECGRAHAAMLEASACYRAWR
ncbi:MAG: sigma factor-like helix-turn-helix DNA-binding protein [Solirubrobacteraceae bacterium]|jgi:hypothetical protein